MCVVDCRGGVWDWFEVPFPRGAGEDERPFWAALGGCGDFGAVSLPFPLVVCLSLFLALWRRSSLCASLAAAGLRRGNEVFGSGRWSGKEFALGGRFDVPFWFAWSSPVSGSFIGWDCGGKLLVWSCCGGCKVGVTVDWRGGEGDWFGSGCHVDPLPKIGQSSAIQVPCAVRTFPVLPLGGGEVEVRCLEEVIGTRMALEALD